MLTLLSTRIGDLAGRLGRAAVPGRGPLLMAGGLLWCARLPVDSAPWLAAIDGPRDAHPAGRRLRSTSCPAILLFGLGISMRRGAADQRP